MAPHISLVSNRVALKTFSGNSVINKGRAKPLKSSKSKNDKLKLRIQSYIAGVDVKRRAFIQMIRNDDDIITRSLTKDMPLDSINQCSDSLDKIIDFSSMTNFMNSNNKKDFIQSICTMEAESKKNNTKN